MPADSTPTTSQGAGSDATVAPRALFYVDTLVNRVSRDNILGSQIIASCTVGSGGRTCTISSGETATRIIGVDLGISRSFVAGSLSISDAASVSTTVSCQSTVLPAGSTWRAKVYGTSHTYQLNRKTYDSEIPGFEIANETSGTLSSFDPYPTALYCY